MIPTGGSVKCACFGERKGEKEHAFLLNEFKITRGTRTKEEKIVSHIRLCLMVFFTQTAKYGG